MFFLVVVFLVEDEFSDVEDFRRFSFINIIMLDFFVYDEGSVKGFIEKFLFVELIEEQEDVVGFEGIFLVSVEFVIFVLQDEVLFIFLLDLSESDVEEILVDIDMD